MQIAFHARDGYLEATFSGPAELAGYVEFRDALLRRPDWTPGTPILVDQTRFDTGPLTVEEVRSIADLCHESRKELGDGRMAILIARDLEYGMARMWGVFVSGRWDIEAELFRERDEAVAWLTA